MPSWSNQPWRRDSNETASGKPGAVHIAPAEKKEAKAGLAHAEALLRSLRKALSS
jgi:hypothetical protein